MENLDFMERLSPGDNLQFYVSRDNNFRRLPIRNRVGFLSETSHELPHLTEPGLVTPLEKVLRSQAQGLPVPFMAGKFLDQDYSIIDQLDKFELFELRESINQNIDQLKQEYHAATVKLSQAKNKAEEEANSSESDTKPPKDTKVPQKASNKADSEASQP